MALEHEFSKVKFPMSAGDLSPVWNSSPKLHHNSQHMEECMI